MKKNIRGRTFFKNKKADTHLPLEVLAELIFILVLTVSLYQFAKITMDNDVFYRHYTSRDVAMLLDSLYASPGTVDYVYTTDVTNQKVDIALDGYVRVTQANQSMYKTAQVFRYGYSNKTELKTAGLVFDNSKTVYFSIQQSRGIIVIRNDTEYQSFTTQQAPSCPLIHITYTFPEDQVLIDRFAEHLTQNRDLYKDAYSLMYLLRTDNVTVTGTAPFSSNTFEQSLESAKTKDVYVLLVKKPEITGVNIIFKSQNQEYDKIYCLLNSELSKVTAVSRAYQFSGAYEKYNQIPSKYVIILEYNYDNVASLATAIKTAIGEIPK